MNNRRSRATNSHPWRLTMRRPMNCRNPVPNELIDALMAVLDAHWFTALKDYCGRGGAAAADTADHLFLKLEVIRFWLDDLEEADEDS